VKLTTHLHVVLRSRISRAIPPLPQYIFMVWCSVKAQGQFYLTLPKVAQKVLLKMFTARDVWVSHLHPISHYVDQINIFHRPSAFSMRDNRMKVKVKLRLCFLLTENHAMKTSLGEWRYSSTHSLTSALDGGEWSASCTGRFTPRERAPGTHWIGDWEGPRAVLDVVVKRKIPSPRRESNPRTPIVQSVA
jgi:hypothetical protein